MAGSMKRKRRMKLAKLWAEFQEEFQLSDEMIALAKSTGYQLDQIREKLEKIDPSLSPTKRIEMLHATWMENLEKKRAAIEAGEIQPKPKKKKSKKKVKHDPAWAKAKTVCRLNQEDIRMAKELGMNPRTLLKNGPSPNQQWKAPVKFWIRDLYEKRQKKMAAKQQRRKKQKTQGQPSAKPSREMTTSASLPEPYPDDPF